MTLTFIRTRLSTLFYLVLLHKSPYHPDPKKGQNHNKIISTAVSNANHIHTDCSLHIYCVLPRSYFPLKSDQFYILISDYSVKKEPLCDYVNGRREIFLLEVLDFKNITFCSFNDSSLCCFLLFCFFSHEIHCLQITPRATTTTDLTTWLSKSCVKDTHSL